MPGHSRARWSAISFPVLGIGSACVTVACARATEPCGTVSADLRLVDATRADTFDTSDGRARLIISAGALAMSCPAAVSVNATDDLPYESARVQGLALVPASGIRIVVQNDHRLRSPVTLVLRYEPGMLPRGGMPNDLRIGRIVRGYCAATQIDGPCTHDPQGTIDVRGGTVLEAAREVRLTIADSIGQGYALVVPARGAP